MSTPGQPRSLGAPPVEALSDITWARVERDLWAAVDRGEAAPADAPAEAATASTPARSLPLPPRRRAVWPYAGAAALVAAAAALIFFLWPSHRQVAAPQHDLPSRVATAAAPTTVSFGDAEITVAPESTLVLAGTPANGVEIILERGSARFAVSPRRGRPPFVVHAGAIDVRVVGTVFTVARSGDAARVDVTHGEVEVVGHGRRVRVHAGGSWDSSRDREAATGSSTASINPDDVAAARTFPEDPVADVPAIAESVRPPRSAVPQVPGAVVVPVDPKQAYEAAAALEPVDTAAAIAAYRKLARRNGPWSANALYAAARLAESYDRNLALQLARQYGRRFPSGANAADAAELARRLTGASHDPPVP